MNILITGANGQLGNEFRDLSAEYPVYNFFFTDFTDLDICDEQAVRAFVKEKDIDVIINCAAYTAVDLAEENAVDCDKINHAAVADLARIAEEFGASLIHFSTDYVFDGTNSIPYREEDPTAAKTIYGMTKLSSERVALAKCSRAMVFRTSWLYSSYGENFVKTVLKLLNNRGSMGVVFDQVGTPTYAQDLARFILSILDNKVVPGVYHFSNEGVCSWYDFAKQIQRIANIAGEIYPIHSEEYITKAERPAFSVLDKSKVKGIFNVKIPYWVDSLEKCIQKIQNDINNR